MHAPRLAVATLAVALATPAPAVACGSKAYAVTVREVTPRIAGVHVEAKSDGRLVLVNQGAATVVVVGPSGAPYARIGRQGVAVNVAFNGRPRWRVSSRAHELAWFDARTEIHEDPPPSAVRREPGKSHHIRNWRIPLEAGGRSYAIVGGIDYRVAGDGLAELLFPLIPVPLLLALVAGVVRTVRAQVTVV